MSLPPQHLLVAVALGAEEEHRAAEELVDVACAIAQPRAMMRLVFVWPQMGPPVGFDIGLAPTATYYRSAAERDARARARALEELRELVRRVQARGHRATAEVIEPRDGIGETIVAAAARHEVDVIVVRSHGRRGWRFFLGSVAERVAHLAPMSVFIERAAPSD